MLPASGPLPVPLPTVVPLLSSWSNLPLTAGALAIEAVFGYPAALFAAIGHPVTWVGALLSTLERWLNRPGPGRRAAGVLALVLLVLAAVAPALVLQGALPWVATAVLAAALPAQRSLYVHVRAVGDGLARGGLEGGRRAVSHIVGRDPESLDEAGVIRAAIESLAENFSDGVVAPAVWGVAGGLAGMMGYKAINTADSMVGHRSERYRLFGWASARLDDLVNLPASRLAAVWLVLAAGLCGERTGGAARAVWRDGGRHRSPNAGWPEAAMAGALGIRLAGPRAYGGVSMTDGWMGDGPDPVCTDLGRALRLYRVACGLQWAVIAGLAGLL